MKNNNFFTRNLIDFDNLEKSYLYDGDDLGVHVKDNKFTIKLWQPFAKNVRIYIYENSEDQTEIEILNMNKNSNVWEITLDKSYERKYYLYEVENENQTKLATDPYSFSLSAVKWDGGEELKVKSAIVDIEKIKGNSPRWNSGLLPRETNIYELHIRDYTSSLDQNKFKSRFGTFNAAREAGIFEYLNEIGINHLQLLPIHSCYTLDETNIKKLNKNDGQKWNTNYNWGYDPLNYFSINGSYSSNPHDPYARLYEFKDFVNDAHKHNIGIILDVVYNHLFTNNTLNDILPGYYFRNESKINPVSYPPLASQRFMVRKLIVDSLKYFMEYFDVDGYRFDLSSFIDKETTDIIYQELSKIKKNVVLHGEAWSFTDLAYDKNYVKGFLTNDINFAYFNDTTRNAIKGSDHSKDKGLFADFTKSYFLSYVNSVVSNLIDYDFKNYAYSHKAYDLFCSNVDMNLQYNACHDGFTLWDKLNVSTTELSFLERIQRYRQALIMTATTQGRILHLAGTELLQSKPADRSGMDFERTIESNYYDELNDEPESNRYHPNSYKTTDFVNSLKWNHLKNYYVKEYVFDFFAKLNKFRNQSKIFTLSTEEVYKNVKLKVVDENEGILIYEIKYDSQTYLIAHNFSEQDYIYDMSNYDVVFDNKIKFKGDKKRITPHTSLILKEK
ncbi:alpha-amylase family glycosyl hydrolase [Mycoplasma anserisalpingitidis]|uniref:alpha-amylase family glycosyl hydrolase n=1 Tax=Mycoplasma anserisalpingitidis TaxID=519450 RepID=UPI001EED78EF|nr:alpha-amylase family glycosyl hydrolase [Mycoplasma anserisalpingitidis]